jgi:sugar lactone lactonase YvrE
MHERRHEVAVALSCEVELGEGPVWDERTEMLWFVDILRGGVYRLDPVTGAHAHWTCDRLLGALALSHEPGIVALATDRGFEIWDLSRPSPVIVAAVGADDDDIRMNDGKVAPDGSFWAGTMSMRGDDGRGELHRLGGDGTTEVLVGDLTLSNGLGWSPDASTFYLIDSPRDAIFAHRLDDDLRPGPGSVLIDTSSFPGLPDGMTVDADGFLWVCFWGGGTVRRFEPTGTLAAEYPVPVANPTSCAFGGPGLDRLFVTTARYGLTAAERMAQPLAGAVLEIAPGVAGLAPGRVAIDVLACTEPADEPEPTTPAS